MVRGGPVLADTALVVVKSPDTVVGEPGYDLTAIGLSPVLVKALRIATCT